MFRKCHESPGKGPFRGPKVDQKSSRKCGERRWPFWFASGATCGTFGFRSGTFGPLSSTERYVEPHRRCVRRGAKVVRKGRGRSRTGGEGGSFGNFRVTSGSTSTPLDRGNKEHSGRSGALPGCKGVLVGTGGRAGKKTPLKVLQTRLGNGCRRRAGRWWGWLVRQRARQRWSVRRRARARTAVRAWRRRLNVLGGGRAEPCEMRNLPLLGLNTRLVVCPRTSGVGDGGARGVGCARQWGWR